MPQFAFSATDSMGNKVEGTIFAGDAGGATQQVQQMGYSPQRIEEAARPATVGEPTQILPVWNVAAPSAPLVPLGGEPENQISEMAREEPWQRGGPVAPSTSAQPTLTLNAYGNVVPTQRMETPRMAPAAYSSTSPAAQGGTGAGRDVAIPYGANGAHPTTFGKRLAEAVIYPIFAGVVFKELPPYFRQFATLINAGIPLYQALGSLEAATANKKLKEVAREGQRQVEAGGKFSDVMAAYPWIFQPVQIELVRAAEQGGMLDVALKQIADYVEHELEIRRLISRETLYPKIVLFVALQILGIGGITGGMMALVGLVLGQLTPLQYFEQTIGAGFGLIIPIFVTVAVFRLFLFNVPGVREAYDTVKMYAPVTGKITRMFTLSRFTRTFATLYRAGFTIPQCLRIAGDACGNSVLRNVAQQAIRRTEAGGLVSDALADSHLVPPIALNMFRTGETTGNLDATLDKVADYYESEGKMKSHQGAVILGVVVFLIVAVMVGVQIVGFYTGGSYTGGIKKEMKEGE